MSWIQKLYETYNNCQSMIGVVTNDDEVPLLPICHTTQKAQIEISIDGNGNFRRARVIPRNEARTIIPCTENSGGRTSGEAPHPLCDKLQYVSADYSKWGGSKKSYFVSYKSQLEKWCTSEYSDPKVIAVLKYINKGNVIGDLVEHQVLIPDDNGKLLPKLNKKKEGTVIKIFDVLTSQEDAFIRWEVETPGELETKVWKDKTLWDKWIHYYTNTKQEKSLCYVTGRMEFAAVQHSAKIQGDGDKAKLISSNDWEGFTFRGRFTDTKNNNHHQTCSVGFEVTQKAHNALRWLINRQGYKREGLAIVAWATAGETIPRLMDSTLSIIGIDDLPDGDLPIAETAQEIAIKFQKKIAGYGREIGDTTNVVVMGIDSATPGKGRMAVIYYRELNGSEFLLKINDWHESSAWINHYVSIVDQNKGSGKPKKQYITYFGAPSPNDIAESVYGTNINGKIVVDEKMRKLTIERILPCIIDGQQLPRDIVETAIRRASKRMSLDYWQWNKALSIACSLFRKYNRKEDYSMTLEPNRKTRDYLYGRLLALAESLEEWALNKAGEDRQTNAERLMQRFSEHPYTTWKTIELALTPYKARLGGKSKKRQRMIDEVISSFNDVDFLNDKRLSGEFLLGYHCQREFLRSNLDLVVKTDNENPETTINTIQ